MQRACFYFSNSELFQKRETVTWLYKAVAENIQRQITTCCHIRQMISVVSNNRHIKKMGGKVDMLLRNKGFEKFSCIPGNLWGHAHDQRTWEDPKLLLVTGMQALANRKTRQRTWALKTCLNKHTELQRLGDFFFLDSRHLETSLVTYNKVFSLPNNSL